MAPQTRGFEFKLTAEPDNVPVVRRALRALLVTADVPPARARNIELAATEVCARRGSCLTGSRSSSAIMGEEWGMRCGGPTIALD